MELYACVAFAQYFFAAFSDINLIYSDKYGIFVKSASSIYTYGI